MYQEILKAIQESQAIAIFRHTHPDGDATGSQLGLKAWILAHFKDKDVRALGLETFQRLPFVDEADDAFIKNALAIVVDTSNVERIDDERYKMAKKVIKIDHHPALDNFGDLNFVNTDAAATAEYLTHILSSFEGYEINKDAAEYLYCGILTDTLNFKTTSTSYSTFDAANKLAKTGIDVADLALKMNEESYETFEIITRFRTHLKIEKGIGKVILNQKDLNELGITSDIAKTFIAEFSLIKDLKIWIVFAQNEKGTYDGSLRSRKEYPINEIAQKYKGGGHPCAAGVKALDEHQLINLIEDLNQLVQ